MRKTLVLVWIYGVLEDIHLNKEFGGLSEAFNKMGFETLIVVEKNNLSIIPPYMRVIELSLSNSLLRELKTLSWMKLFRVIWFESPEIVIFRHPYYYSVLTILVYRLLGFLSGRRSVFFYKMDSDGIIRLKGILRGIRRFAWVSMSYVYDWIMIETSCGANRVKELMFFRRERLVVVPNSYSANTFSLVHYDECLRKPVIFVAARLTRAKGLEYLIDAFGRIAEKHKEWVIRVAGKVSDVQYYNDLKALIVRLRLENRVFFLGHLSSGDLKREYMQASIFCLPSIRESFGIVRLEAIACGLPVVTSDAGCGSDFSRMGCLVFRVGQTDSLTSILDELMANERIRKEVSERQQKNLVTWDTISEKIYNLYCDKTALRSE